MKQTFKQWVESETFEGRLNLLVNKWQQQQIDYEKLAEDNIESEHNNKKFTYKAMATRDCWKELLTLLNEFNK
jgi:hypothetical protein